MKKLSIFLSFTVVMLSYTIYQYRCVTNDLSKHIEDEALHKIKIYSEFEDYIEWLEQTIEEQSLTIDTLREYSQFGTPRNPISILGSDFILSNTDTIPILVKATMYHPVEAQCDESPLITADGSKIHPYQVSQWNWIAVSQDLLKRNGGIFDYGDKVYIKGTHRDGIYTIRDCMNKRKTNQIDILESIGTNQYKYDEIEIYALAENN
tara:strand:- start:123 stop:743 length:621 start_codon:yes stop_codon:yes gene_type:complete